MTSLILITGGMGFIGSHTARALLDRGEPCVLAQRRSAEPPDLPWLNDTGPVVLEQVDVADLTGLMEIGKRHRITGIVHLAGSVPWPPGAFEPVDGARRAIGSLLNVVQAARDWGVDRLCVASTIGVYGGVEGPAPLREDAPLPMTASHVIPAYKKIGELLTDHLAGAIGVEIVAMRISAVWGPLGRPSSMFFPAPQLVHAAARGGPVDLSPLRGPVYAGNGIDACYVSDCARAIASLQLAESLNHRVYNVASGRLTTNGEFVAALQACEPGFDFDLVDGRDPQGPAHDVCLDITRIRQDTGYEPAYDTHSAVADYLAWLRAGRPK